MGSRLIAGMDEAGRGPVLGSLCIGLAIFREDDLPILDQIGVDDSKKISPKKRREFAIQIKKHALSWNVFEYSAEDLNKLHEKGLSLNQIEELGFGKLLNDTVAQNPLHTPHELYLDAADVKEERFGQSIGKLLRFTPEKIISKHGGDALFKIVGAASILAKTRRDEIIEDHKKVFGAIGSGYPSDPNTQKFLKSYYKEHQNFPSITRTWWKTAENIKKEFASPSKTSDPKKKTTTKKMQKKLTDF